MPPKKGLSVIEYNTKLLEILDTLYREIEYPIGKTRYKKKIQTEILQQNAEYRKLDVSMVGTHTIPLITSQAVLEKFQTFLEKEWINPTVSSVVNGMKLDFKTLFGLIRMVFIDVSSRCYNVSVFYKNISRIVDSQYENWEELLEKEGENVVFFFLQLLALSVDNVKVVLLPEKPVFGKTVQVIYEKELTLTHSGIKNLWQQVNYMFASVEKTGWFENNKMEYTMHCSLVLYGGKKKLDGQLEPEWVSLFHQPTIEWMNVRNHDVILNKTGTFLLTFGAFLQTKKPVDRMRFLLAGGLSKSVYNVRETSDVDFFVMDYNDSIEEYGSYKPNIGVENIFDDFGKTWYANEKYYFPMIPELYDAQREYKRTMVKPTGTKNIMNNYPPYSVSGLKAGRYIDIYAGLCRKMGYNIHHLDDLLCDPAHRIYVFGSPVVQLKLELVRDMIKDIDLGRISKKQSHDLHYLVHNYDHLFEGKEKHILELDRIEERMGKDPLLSLTVNCYHQQLEGASFEPLIRRYPMYMEEIVGEWIRSAPLIVSSNNRIVEQDMMRVYQRPLLSSLPEKIMEPTIYYYEISADGQMNIYVGEEASFFEDVVVSGQMKVDVSKDKKISVNVSGSKMKKIYQQLEKTEEKKEYRMMLINMMKTIIQMHKMIDCHTTQRVMVDLLK